MVFGLYIAVTIACVVLTAPLVDYAASWLALIGYSLPIFLLSLLACAVVVVFYSLISGAGFFNGISSRRFYGISLLLGLLLFGAQLYLQKSAGFVCGWDVGTITQVGERAPSDIAGLARYLSIYPNQAFLYGLFRKLSKIASVAGVSSYKVLVCCGSLCVTAAIVIAASVCRRLFGEGRALVFQIFASVFLGLSGWVLVPYSDAYGMLFTCAALWFYVMPRKRFVRLLGLTTVSILGYMIKPTAIFLLFAVICLDWLPEVVRLLFEAFRAVREAGRKLGFKKSGTGDKKLDLGSGLKVHMHGKETVELCVGSKAKYLLKVAAPVVLGVFLAAGVGQYVKGSYINIEPGASRGIAHYLSMGINPSSKGFYAPEENELSESIEDPDKRQAALLDLWVKHVRELGPVGVLKIWFEKNLTNYSDGSFAWKREVIGGSRSWTGWHIDSSTKTPSIYGDSLTVKSWYGIVDEDERDEAGMAYGWYCQILWFATLVGCASSALRRGRSVRSMASGEVAIGADHICSVMALTLIFLSGFLLIFECRARYLFLFSPYYVLFAVDGLVGEGSLGDYAACKLSYLRSELKGSHR